MRLAAAWQGRPQPMQKPNPQKRRRILDAAARLFAGQRYHDVRLEDVAQAAQVGKGTIYIYFESKDELYLALVDEGFRRLVAELRESGHERGRSALVELRGILQALVRFAIEHPNLVELMRSSAGGAGTRWSKARGDLTDLLEETLRRGVRRKEIRDPDPALTALCIPGLVRSAIFFGPRVADERALTRRLMRLLEQGIARGRGK
jgi:AcrR family transcriptional regulator